MTTDLCTVDNQAEAEALKQLLEDHDIEAHIVQQQSSAYPGQLLASSWGVIRVEEADLPRARELVDEWMAARPVTPREREPAPRPPGPPVNERQERVAGVLAKGWAVARTILLVGSLALNVHLIVKYVWHPQKDEVLATDADGRPTARFHYEPWDAFPHQTDSFTRKGIVSASWFDRDRDGWNELSQTFHEGQIVWEGRDGDQDGTFERSIGYAGGKKSVELNDRDQDTRPDEIIGFRDGKPRAWLHDRDADGFPESASCSDAGGAVRERRLDSCDL